ncbi:VCBS repeat-containing protein [Adhaeribacter rhizoryzae]|uniref:VCBS repeat-containing protein n=1 Tax=Adhaeribacter rhizoryzae TaxID=2607907 RepID=A0A5M6DNL3_9BACT|nr:VCBS repeat-containing protein [Adhaeribacter rhizoryzae]KAA5549131.1 VCBS repeat-containing protein [Adhaeribacter rhizoryzae]
MKNYYSVFFLILLLSLAGCNKNKPLFERKTASETGISFINTVTPNDSLNLLSYEYFYNGGGVAVGDVNNDGLSDIYFTGNTVSSRLYINQGNFKFKDVTEQAKVGTQTWATGVAMVDINQDNLLDIYVCVADYRSPELRKNLLYINKGLNKEGIPTYAEEGEEYGLADNGYGTQAVFFDYDKDNDLDVYILCVNKEDVNPNLIRQTKKPKRDPSVDRLYRNNGNNTFTNVSEEAGINQEGFGLGVVVTDINQDGWPDLYVANDFIFSDQLLINNQNGTFSDSIKSYIKHTSQFSMGTDIADFNNDGLMDIVTVDMMPADNKRQKLMNGVKTYDEFNLAIRRGYMPQYVRNNLQLNNGNGTFSEISQLAGVHQTDWSWAALLADFDNDGHRDLFISNGIRKDITHLDFVMYHAMQKRARFGRAEGEDQIHRMVEEMEGVKNQNALFRNNGDLTFTNKSEDWGLKEFSFTNGAAYADFDNDGDLDLVMNNIDEEPYLYENNTLPAGKNKDKNKATTNNYLRLKLKGGVLDHGTKVNLRYKGQKQVAEYTPYRGFQSTVEPYLHFGLGNITQVDSLEVIWPDGKYQLLQNIKANQLLTLQHQDADAKPLTTPKSPQTLFTEVSQALGIDYQHQDAEYVDFKVQPLLPHKFSQNGPGMAVGDVNNDGLEDFYVGAGANKLGKLFVQNAQGKFKATTITDKPSAADEMGVLLFDADNDKDLDLYVVGGGSESRPELGKYQNRLFRNNGRGQFTEDPQALPPIITSGSCVIAADYDQDGDLDLFIGGRVEPQKYPLPVKSCILRNEGGRFVDATSAVCKELENIGMVTSALWTDFDQDGKVDLLVAGEWMPLTFFKNTGGNFKNVTAATGLSNTSGWWNSLVAGDFDNDGDIDYAAGNLGLNSRFKASVKEPIEVYAKDFDKNGSTDAIMSFYIAGKKYPVPGRDEMIDQIVSTRRDYPSYEKYANLTFAQMYPPEKLAGTYAVKAETFKTSYLENLGGGKFSIKALPVQAQVAPVFGMSAQDYNQDGHLDLVLTGNSYATEVMTGAYDAFIGLYLQGNGKGNFVPVPVTQSGFFVDGDAKGVAGITLANGQALTLVSQFNNKLKAFAVNKPASTETAKVISLQPLDAFGIEYLENGQQRKCEFYYGSTYLSQSSRKMLLGPDVKSIEIFDYNGKSRKVTL